MGRYLTLFVTLCKNFGQDTEDSECGGKMYLVVDISAQM